MEISNIYKKNDSVRKLHNLLIAPDLVTVSKINSKLNQIGNLKADGRPILGLDSKELLKITLSSSSDAMFIPAHIWTPWFALFGSKSGFDSLVEAFDEEAKNIFAVETGLSSDPFMNWRLSQLDNLTLVSNSDAHSPQKLAREANVIKVKPNYFEITNAIKKGDDRFIGTIEFFPEEGKYHYDGHRLCNVSLKPSETNKLKGICPKCGKPLVVGVQNRVDKLADRPDTFKPKAHKKVEYIIPLTEIIANEKGVKSSNSKSIQEYFFKAVSALGDEFKILRHVPIEKFKEEGFERLGHLIQKMREGDVFIEPGYDGVFGVIKIIPSLADTPQMALNL